MKTKHKNGKGKMEFRDGSVYTGEWKNGYFHGHGELILPDRKEI